MGRKGRKWPQSLTLRKPCLATGPAEDRGPASGAGLFSASLEPHPVRQMPSYRAARASICALAALLLVGAARRLRPALARLPRDHRRRGQLGRPGTPRLFELWLARVDEQGWGENVTTTGYGDMFNPDNDVRRYYTRSFNGTSSATPIVASTVLAIQGVRQACGLPPLRPLEMRNLLARTGTRQGEPLTTNIGPLPNLAAALRASVPAPCLPGRGQPQAVSGTAD